MNLKVIRDRAPFSSLRHVFEAQQKDGPSHRAMTLKVRAFSLRVWHLKFPNESEVEDSSVHVFHVVRFDLQPDRSRGPQEIALIRDIPIEKYDIEVLFQTKEVPIGFCFRDCATDVPETAGLLFRSRGIRELSRENI
jgi:hypothetical protein